MKMIDKWLEMKLIENADQDEPSSQDRVNGNKSHQGSSVPDGKAKAAAPGFLVFLGNIISAEKRVIAPWWISRTMLLLPRYVNKEKQYDMFLGDKYKCYNKSLLLEMLKLS
jgi:hypothetical protein